MNAPVVILAGGSGLIGRSLRQRFASKGYRVITLSRTPGPERLVWDGKTLGEWAEQLETANIVINLTGETIAQKFTSEAKQRILESRVQATSVIAEAIQQSKNKPYWINASASGFYGDRADEILTEDSSAGTGFLSETCKQWEAPVSAVDRAAIVRIGVVLEPSGGALQPLVKLTKLFLGGTVGSGNQYMPWIHIDDLVSIFVMLAETQRTGGARVWNASAPNPVTNREFMATLREVLERPAAPPAPAFAIQAMGNLIGPDASLILGSTRMVPQRLMHEGFVFRYPVIQDALRELLVRS